jgi:thioredoxin-like negative regulator of GroEL
LVGRGTFSASQFILDDIDRLTDATFIGEPASSRPTGYGDAYKAILPNSGIAVRSSIKYWQSGQDMRAYTPIDVAAPLTFADYAAGRDPALETALAYQPEPTLGEQLVAAAKTAGAQAALKAATAYADDPAHRYGDVERKLVVAEQVALAQKQGPAALEVARWSVKRFPRNGDLATVLALVAKAQGNRDEALKAIEAALAIDPSNRSAQSLKEEIEKK